MNFKFIGFVSSLFLFTFAFANDTNDTLIISDCKFDELLITPITFFVPTEVLGHYSESMISNKIEKWIDFSNLALYNSCVPMKRTISDIKYIQELTEPLFQDLHAAHNMLEYYFGYEEVSQIGKDKTHFYGLVFSSYQSSFKSEWCGKTDVETLPNFFMLALNCTDDMLEHELGHLSWAQHDIKNYRRQFSLNSKNDEITYSKNVNKIAPYAFGFECGGKGTLMSYAKEVIPIYSSPDILFNGERCGSNEYANNAKVIRDYALGLLSSNK